MLGSRHALAAGIMMRIACASRRTATLAALDVDRARATLARPACQRMPARDRDRASRAAGPIGAGALKEPSFTLGSSVRKKCCSQEIEGGGGCAKKFLKPVGNFER
jgi:hypothetical protein